ncbi:ATP-binding protein [Amycolatopsis sp.]|uniref:ATP-binding protein n=1 Tax=Amycolatopsis sp. TaxID=37632 RepID=UPI002E0AC3BA|nr:ATP-binding protein [Amycolatopsis sp.]
MPRTGPLPGGVGPQTGGVAAAEKGFRVKYTPATKLVNELVEAVDDKALAKTIARYGRVDLLIIDELGYMELDRRGGRTPVPGPDRTRGGGQRGDRRQSAILRMVRHLHATGKKPANATQRF